MKTPAKPQVSLRFLQDSRMVASAREVQRITEEIRSAERIRATSEQSFAVKVLALAAAAALIIGFWLSAAINGSVRQSIAGIVGLAMFWDSSARSLNKQIYSL